MGLKVFSKSTSFRVSSWCSMIKDDLWFVKYFNRFISASGLSVCKVKLTHIGSNYPCMTDPARGIKKSTNSTHLTYESSYKQDGKKVTLVSRNLRNYGRVKYKYLNLSVWEWIKDPDHTLRVILWTRTLFRLLHLSLQKVILRVILWIWKRRGHFQAMKTIMHGKLVVPYLRPNSSSRVGM